MFRPLATHFPIRLTALFRVFLIAWTAVAVAVFAWAVADDFDSPSLARLMLPGRIARYGILWSGGAIAIVAAGVMAVRRHEERECIRAALVSSEAELEAIFNDAPVALILLNARGQVRRANPAGRKLLPATETLIGLRPGEALQCAYHFLSGEGCGDGAHCEQCPLRQGIAGALERRQRLEGVKVQLTLMTDGRVTPRHFLLSATPLQTAGEEMALLSLQDVTERSWAEAELVKLNQFLRVVIDGTNVWVSSLDENYNYILWNNGAEAISGYMRQEVLGHNKVWDWIGGDPEWGRRFKVKLDGVMAGGALDDLEHVIRTRSGETRVLSVYSRPLRNADGKPIGIVNVAIDVTERHQAEERLRHDSLHDMLTELPNRLLFQDRLTQCLHRAQRHPDYRFAVLFLDIDHFKVINDSLGHVTGDQLLVAIARTLQANLRGGDTVASPNLLARMGGDEFTILLDDIRSPDDATRIAHRLEQEVAKTYRIGGHEVAVTASIGVVLSDARYHAAEEMLRDADTAMYRAKAEGRARFALFDQRMHEQVHRRLQLENDLRKALDRDELLLVYQPILFLASGKLRGFEALIRWKHPQRGLISPVDFIPIAEETGLIVPIGRWVLRTACRQLAEWRRRMPASSPLSMNINVSRQQIAHDSGLIAEVKTAVGELPPECVHLEITESTIIQDAQQVVRVLQEIKKLGVKLVVDDFGTGYSSLSCLHRFPLDGLKIDRSFVSNMSGHPDYEAIVQAIVTLAHNLRMRVTAEGIETAGQADQLRSLACDHVQGFHFALPLSVQDAEAFIERHSLETAAS